MKQPHTIKDEAKPVDQKLAERPVEQRTAEPKAAKFEPKLESKDDHVAHIAQLARKLQETQPGSQGFARDILYHVTAIQNPEAYNANVAAEQKAAFEADALSAKQRGRVPAGDKAKVA